ncbi:MAG TPA: N-6 DNA methylase [Conexibacter sp.]|nr:N-6 DNA methylase [Conexibacter sp.]
MKGVLEVTPEKLRGGFYTPDALVSFCLNRVAELSTADEPSVLEPSAGDGAFLRGLLSTWPKSAPVGSVTAVEIDPAEAERCRAVLHGRPGRVVTGSVLRWALDERREYDVAVGNPPFVRFQFVSAADRTAAVELSERLGVSPRGVANLWIPVLLAAIHRLRAGGAFSFVVPTECFTGASAGHLREWLLRETDRVTVDLFPPGSFPRVLQEVAVLSGVRTRPAQATLTIRQRASTGTVEARTLAVPVDRQSWTRYLLDARQQDALAAASALPAMRSLGEIARFEVSIVTGANGFFSVDDATVERWDLGPWCEPLLARIRHAPGLRFVPADHRRLQSEGLPAWLLNFTEGAPDPEAAERSAAYLRHGEEQGLHRRFKCRIREPWFRVPNFQRGDLMLSKRSHQYPRMVVNEAAVYTTDTIYRGRMISRSLSARALAALFHNSLTLLTAEIEGRSFGGGVLELVPSEVARLVVPVFAAASGWLARLDRLARDAAEEDLVAATDSALVEAGVLDAGVLEVLADARRLLLDRRLERNAQPRSEQDAPVLLAA